MENLGTGQLIKDLVAFLRENGPDKFDDVVAQAKNQLTAEQKQSKCDDLEKLFDIQIATFKDLGVPDEIIKELQNQKKAVVQKASGMTIGQGNIPFLPVIKPVHLGYHGLMAMVWNRSKKGCICLKPAAVTDQFETPDDIYYIYNVEDGNATRGKNTEEAEEIFKKQLRSPLTAVEVINLCILTDVLLRHYVWAAGSRYESAGKVPIVYLDNGDRPGLYWSYAGGSSAHWGSASCGSR